MVRCSIVKHTSCRDGKCAVKKHVKCLSVCPNKPKWLRRYDHDDWTGKPWIGSHTPDCGNWKENMSSRVRRKFKDCARSRWCKRKDRRRGGSRACRKWGREWRTNCHTAERAMRKAKAKATAKANHARELCMGHYTDEHGQRQSYGALACNQVAMMA